MISPTDPLLKTTGQLLAELAPPDASLCIAYSGGLDSTVLLDLLQRLRPGRVRAAHVHHGLQAGADEWAAHCQMHCEQQGIRCTVLPVTVSTEHGSGLEAAAREARYAALANELKADEYLVTAHHQQDQLETVLLALMRGSGVHGIAAMPAKAQTGGMTLLRPLLDAQRDELESYARRANLVWIDDPSNADTRFDRNYLRATVVPLLEQRWPAAARSAARSARLSAAAKNLLDERAADDLRGQFQGHALRVAALSALNAERRANALRWFCRHLKLPVPSEAQGREALSALLDSREDAAPLAAWPGVRVRRYREGLYWFSEESDPGAAEAGAPMRWEKPAAGEALDLGRSRGRLRLVPSKGQALRVAALNAGVVVRFRSGGEALRVDPGGRSRDLKKLLQEEGVLPWMRKNIPLVYIDDELAAVGDFWLNHDHPAVAAEGGLVPQWRLVKPLRGVF